MDLFYEYRDPVLLVAGIVVIAVLILIIGDYFVRRRREAIGGFARTHGFFFLPFMERGWEAGEPSGRVLKRMKKKLGPGGRETVGIFDGEFSFGGWSLPVMEEGSSREFSNLMFRAEGDERTAVFDYSYTVGSGKNSHTYNQTIALFRDMGAGYPEFDLKPESYLHKLISVFGYQDIDFQDTPGFSGEYLLRGKKVPAIKRLFDRGLRERMASHKGFTVQAGGDNFLIFRHSKVIDPDKMGNFIMEASNIHEEFLRRVQSHG